MVTCGRDFGFDFGILFIYFKIFFFSKLSYFYVIRPFHLNFHEKQY